MIILSHRGRWNLTKQKNSREAIVAALDGGFGVETDIRDCKGQLVISHEPVVEPCLALSEILEYHTMLRSGAPLALNVKSDGLSFILRDCLSEYCIANYFVFDMSVPDTLSYIKAGLNFYTRQSEYEGHPSFYDSAAGIWLDEFHSHWITSKIILEHILNGKKVGIVSPELHGRSYQAEWEDYKKISDLVGSDALILCTDFPDLARDYFNGNPPLG